MTTTRLGRRHCFLVETHDDVDALLRVLTPFAVMGASIASATLARGERGCAVRVEADGLCEQRAETLLRRLEGLPVVRSVGLGWVGLAQAAA